MDVLPEPLRVPRAPLCNCLAHVHPILASGVNSSAVASAFQAKDPTNTEGLSVSLPNNHFVGYSSTNRDGGLPRLSLDLLRCIYSFFGVFTFRSAFSCATVDTPLIFQKESRPYCHNYEP